MSPGRYRTAREVSCVRYMPVSRLPVEAMRPLSTIFPVLFTPLNKYLRQRRCISLFRGISVQDNNLLPIL